MPDYLVTRSNRIALAMAAAIAAAVLSACQTTPKPSAQTQPATRPAPQADASIPEVPFLGVEPVAKGVYIAIDRRQPLAGDALVRARLTRAEVLAAVTQKVAPAQAATQPATQPQSASAGTPRAPARASVR